MTFEEAKNELKQGFEKHDFEIVDEHITELFIKKNRIEMFKLTEDDIRNFQEAHDSQDKMNCKPFETSLVCKTYREQIVQFSHPIRSRFLPHREFTAIFGNENDDDIYVTIGNCSKSFVWTNLFNDSFFEYTAERLRFKHRRNCDDTFYDMIYKPMSIKVFNMRESSIELAIKKSNSIIDSCLFSYTSLKNNPIGILEEWPNKRLIREREFEFSERKKGNEFKLPKVKFNQNLVRFYQLASSTDIESYKFLSYYHILEYYFLSISDNILYERLSQRINDLKFKTNPTNLDRIIQDVNTHRSETDEVEMLKNVLNKLVIEDELIDFIKKYEEYIGEGLYTKKKSIFGTDIPGTNLNPGHVIGVISKRIKTIRNALVHSSDKHERKMRFIPFSLSTTNVIKRELPLMKFLAEKIIVATAD